MLTLFLLVVLGGGAGLLAVSLVDSRGLSRLVGRLERPSLRAPRSRHTTAPAGTAATEDATAPAATVPVAPEDLALQPVIVEAEPVVVEAEILETGPVGEVLTVAAPSVAPANGTVGPTPRSAIEAATGPPRARRSEARSVPAQFTAVEGTYREVARATPARRLTSLVALVVLVVALGVAAAALAGAAMGAAAELLDRAIG